MCVESERRFAGRCEEQIVGKQHGSCSGFRAATLLSGSIERRIELKALRNHTTIT
jgi:hypothetical protein